MRNVEKNHVSFIIFSKNIKKIQEPRVMIQTAVQQITLYLRGLNLRKVTG